MKYDIEVLKKMIDVYTMNIESFSRLPSMTAEDEDLREGTLERIADMVANRRLVAAMIENEGEPVVPPKFRNGNVFFDTMLYSANKPNADTSWW